MKKSSNSSIFVVPFFLRCLSYRGKALDTYPDLGCRSRVICQLPITFLVPISADFEGPHL